MTWIAATDPLALLSLEAGAVPAPEAEKALAGQQQMTGDQRSVVIGEPVPIVFARRRDGIGGILVSPGATEARFENDGANQVTASYHLVVSEGQIDSVQVRDVFGGSCRVGSHSQTFDRRAGTWLPGNFIEQRPGYDLPVASYYCGSVGAYSGLSTVSYQVQVPNGSDEWKRQVHLFIRGGMHVTRLVDNVKGPSDNFADLAKWLLQNTERVPASLIDNARLLSAAAFLEANGFRCNIEINKSGSYGDLVAKMAPYFLLTESNFNGQRGLRPLLPTANGSIITTPLDWDFIFDESSMVAESLEINYTTLADRQPFVVQVQWRQQLDADVGIVRTAEIRYAETAPSGPYESHDLSAFCTSETHAVKVAAYLLSRRVNTTHSVRFKALPEQHSSLLVPGSICRIRLNRQASNHGSAVFDHLYQIERVTKTLAGDVTYEASHLPLDDEGCLIIAKDVVNATGTGILLSSNRTGLVCDSNSASDTTVPAETGQSAGSEAINAGRGGKLARDNEYGSGSIAGDGPASASSNPTDGLDVAPTALTKSQLSDGSRVLEIPLTCASGQQPQNAQWRYSKSGTESWQTIPGNISTAMPIRPIVPGVRGITGTAEITTPGDRWQAIWYCPEDDGSRTKVISDIYTVQSGDITWNPNTGLNFPAVGLGYSVWYYLQDPTTKVITAGLGNGFVYEDVWLDAAQHIVRGWQASIYTSGTVNPWGVAQNQNLVYYSWRSIASGPTSSAGVNGSVAKPPDWTESLFNNGNALTPL